MTNKTIIPLTILIVGIVLTIVGITHHEPPLFGRDDTTIANLQTKYDQATEIKAKYNLEDGALVRNKIINPELDKYKGEPKDEVKVVIGNKIDPELMGAGETNFEPTIELTRWNEVGFKITPDISDVALKDRTLTFDKEKILFDTPKMSFEMYEYTGTTIDDSGYKYIWYLNEKPADTKDFKVQFKLETSGLDFFYQPPLTQEYQNGYSEEFQKEIIVTETQVKDLEGNVLVERPEDIVDSWAIYHRTKGGLNDINGKDYKTGKFGHIKRIKLSDANGLKAWGHLDISEPIEILPDGTEIRIYSIEPPQSFLDKAVYPIKSNDWFGSQSTSGSDRDFYASNRLHGSLSAPTEGGTATSMTIRGKRSSTYAKGILVLESDLTIISNGVTNPTFVFTSDYTWRTATFSTPPTITVQNYYISAIADNRLYVLYDSTGTKRLYDSSNSYSSPQDATGGTIYTDSALFSIYVTYEPSAPPAAAPEGNVEIKSGTLHIKDGTLQIK